VKQAALSAKPHGIIEVYSEEVAFIFDQHKILTIEVCVLSSIVYTISVIAYWLKFVLWYNVLG